MTTTQMQEIKPGETVHLFEVMQKHNVTCSMEFKPEGMGDPLFGITTAPITLIDSISSERCVVVMLGEFEFAFEIENNSFFKDISDSQIGLCIANEHFSAWINSGIVPKKGIWEAWNYSNKLGRNEK